MPRPTVPLFLSLCLSLCLPAHAQESLWPALSSPAAVGGGSKDAAIVVAIENYTHVGDIDGARQNGEDWYRYLTRGRGIPAERVALLVDGQATTAGIENAVSQMAGQVQGGGTLWFVFIGHGAPSKNGQDGLLLEVDVRGEALSIYDRSIRQSELIRSLEAGQQERTVVLLDACFSGQSSGSGGALAEGLQPLVPGYATSTGSRTVILSAGGSDQFAGPLPGARRPAFSYLALGALQGWGDSNGDAVVTAQEVADYSASALRSVLTGRQQTPMLSGVGEGWSLGKGQSTHVPDLAEIRLKLLGSDDRRDTSVEVVGGVGGVGDALAELERLSAEEAARARRKQELEAQIQAEVSEKSRVLQTQASADWKRVKSLATGGGDAGKKALETFISGYGSAQVRVGDRSYTVTIGEVAEAQAWLSRYDTGDTGDAEADAYEMVKIRAGSFTMGCTWGQRSDCYDNENPAHSVQLSRDFWLGKYEVTQGLWQEVMGSNPSGFSSCSENCPVEQVSWLDAVKFANALSRLEGLEECYQISGESVSWPRGLDCKGYRLPTEAEWEYAARAGTDLKYAGSNSVDGVAWYGRNRSTTHPVGQKQANAWGLHDMSGNVWEWCWDWSGAYDNSASVDPIGPGAGSTRVRRGGSWYSVPRLVRVASRSWSPPSDRDSYLGLRLSRSL